MYQKAAVAGTARTDTAERHPGRAVEVAGWMGKRFVLLEKPPLYCSYGYELYSCPGIASCRDAADTAFFTKYHRARCDVFAGRTLTVRSVKQTGAEYVVGFSEAVSGKTLYAKTVAGECHEVAYAPDRDSAEKRWKGKYVFSARGFLSDFSTGRSVTCTRPARSSCARRRRRYGRR
jgi:hypothetical protein